MTHRLNPRGYTWQKYLRTAPWLALLAGVGVLLWRGTYREQMVFGLIWFAFIILNFGWKHFGRYVRHGWRSE